MKSDNKKMLYIAYGLILVFFIILILRCSKTNIKTDNIKTDNNDDKQAEFDADKGNIVEGFRGPHNQDQGHDDDEDHSNRSYVQENCSNEPNKISTLNCLNNNNLNIINEFINSNSNIKDRIQKTANLDWAAAETLGLTVTVDSIKKYNKLMENESSKKDLDKAKEELLSISQLIYGIVLSKELNKLIDPGVQSFLNNPGSYMNSNNSIYTSHASNTPSSSMFGSSKGGRSSNGGWFSSLFSFI